MNRDFAEWERDLKHPCPCGHDDCMYVVLGYDWCAGCRSHHRWPVGDPCPVDGASLG